MRHLRSAINARTVVMGAINLVLLSVLVAIVGWGNASEDVLSVEPTKPVALAPLPENSVRQVVDWVYLEKKALFHSNRSFTAKEERDSTEVLPVPTYSVTGTMIRPDGIAIAFLRGTGDGRRLKVGVGDTVDGWEVSGISTKAVALKRGASTGELVSGRPGSSSTDGAALSLTPAGVGSSFKAPVEKSLHSGGIQFIPPTSR